MPKDPVERRVIELTPNHGARITDGVPRTMRMTVLGILSDQWHGTRYFAADGVVHAMRRLVAPVSFGPMARVLAHTVYNPWYEVTVEFEGVRPYVLAELRDGLRTAIEEDTDVLTQWVDADDLLQELAGAKSYADCVAVLARAETPTTT